MDRFSLRGVKRQYLDTHGKLRLLEYEYDNFAIQVMTSPLAPLNLETMDELDVIPSPLPTTLDFLAEKGWGVISQRAVDNQLEGIWVNIPDVLYTFIPIENDNLLNNVKISERIPPLISSFNKDVSDLSKFRRTKKLASILKDYSLYTYSLNPSTFGVNSFIVIPEHIYNVDKLDKKLYFEKDGNLNEVMYADGKLIVNSRAIRNRLIRYVNTNLAHDLPGVTNFTRHATITSYYQSSSDFTSRKNQLVFIGNSSIERWKKNKQITATQNTIFNTLDPGRITPYFYINYNILEGRLAIAQPVLNDSKELALRVAKEWVRSKINIGYRPETPPVVEEEEPYVIYKEDGTIDEKSGVSESKVLDTLPSVIMYRDDTLDVTPKYIALLFV